ncbi:MAG: bifunctional hydroxymethylpyrimidine kinase/phosphomethylpyrimidine kinase [Limnochordia bacterium]|jgi:hydroxymethylpyrimidine/phosphomethylpyrimidine kinase
MEYNVALTIAGSDSGGGAGIQADLKTFAALGVYGTSAITAVTAQNTCGVSGVVQLDADFVGQQIDAVLTDIQVKAVKTGMVANGEIIEAIAGRMEKYGVENLVVDPVMVAASGDHLLEEDAQGALMERLLPLALLVTPNIPEAEVLVGWKIKNEGDMYRAAERILAMGPRYVLLKGGHLSGPEAVDLLLGPTGGREYRARRLPTKNVHGTGCTFAAAITAGLAKGLSVTDAIAQGKEYITGAIAHGLSLGRGAGPTHHFYKYY